MTLNLTCGPSPYQSFLVAPSSLWTNVFQISIFNRLGTPSLFKMSLLAFLPPQIPSFFLPKSKTPLPINRISHKKKAKSAHLEENHPESVRNRTHLTRSDSDKKFDNSAESTQFNQILLKKSHKRETRLGPDRYRSDSAESTRSRSIFQSMNYTAAT